MSVQKTAGRKIRDVVRGGKIVEHSSHAQSDSQFLDQGGPSVSKDALGNEEKSLLRPQRTVWHQLRVQRNIRETMSKTKQNKTYFNSSCARTGEVLRYGPPAPTKFWCLWGFGSCSAWVDTGRRFPCSRSSEAWCSYTSDTSIRWQHIEKNASKLKQRQHYFCVR